MIQILSRYGGRVLHESQADSLRGAIKEVLTGADLTGADLTGAVLTGADLRGAVLTGADLRDAKLNWQSHSLLAEVLRRAAGEEVPRLKIAGLILVQRHWCWEDFLRIDDPEKGWALAALAAHAKGDPAAPAILLRVADAATPAPPRAGAALAGLAALLLWLPGCVVVDASRWPLAVRRAEPHPPAPTPTLGPIEPPPGPPIPPPPPPDSAVQPLKRRRFASLAVPR